MTQRPAPSLPRIVALLIGFAMMAAIVVALIPLPTPASVEPSRTVQPRTAPTPLRVAQVVVAKSNPMPASQLVAGSTMIIASRLARPEVFEHGSWLWKADAAPSSLPADAPLVVTVDLSLQMLSVWRGGHEIGVAVIAYGAPDKPTPLGIFPVIQKDADHRSSIYNGAPMPYALRLTGDGIFVHGSNVRREWGTNGCIGVPTAFAKELFAVAPLGMKVVITDKGVMPKNGDTIPLA